MSKIKTPKLPVDTECRFGNNDKICSDKEALELIKKLIVQLATENNKHTRLDILKLKGMSKEDIIGKAKKFLDCDAESCIFANKKFENLVGVKKAENLKDKLFKPAGPYKDHTWLSNDNIDNILNQWGDIYPGYKHIMFQMIDTLKNVDIMPMYIDGTHSFSIVINTDKANGKGIHWFCVYGELANPSVPAGTECTIEYFNSTGSRMINEVHNWAHKMKNKIEKNTNKSVKITDVSKVDLQKGDSECGLFALWYIYSRLNGVPSIYFSRHDAASDETMFEFRKYVFRKYK